MRLSPLGTDTRGPGTRLRRPPGCAQPPPGRRSGRPSVGADVAFTHPVVAHGPGLPDGGDDTARALVPGIAFLLAVVPRPGIGPVSRKRDFSGGAYPASGTSLPMTDPWTPGPDGTPATPQGGGRYEAEGLEGRGGGRRRTPG
ncbi:hypothetical protein ACFPN0_02670 [Kitasatospora cinereorecta]